MQSGRGRYNPHATQTALADPSSMNGESARARPRRLAPKELAEFAQAPETTTSCNAKRPIGATGPPPAAENAPPSSPGLARSFRRAALTKRAAATAWDPLRSRARLRRPLGFKVSLHGQEPHPMETRGRRRHPRASQGRPRAIRAHPERSSSSRRSRSAAAPFCAGGSAKSSSTSTATPRLGVGSTGRARWPSTCWPPSCASNASEALQASSMSCA